MDEAERCHRLAILDSGVLVADGVPEQLAAQPDGRVLRVRSRQPRLAQASLVDMHGVISVAQIGSELRLLRSERRGVGEECGSSCWSRGWLDHYKKNKINQIT